MSKNPKTMDFDHPGSIDVVEEENEVMKELASDNPPSYIEKRRVFGTRYVRAIFSDDEKENKERMKENALFKTIVEFFTEKADMTEEELFDGYPAGEVTEQEVKEFL